MASSSSSERFGADGDQVTIVPVRRRRSRDRVSARPDIPNGGAEIIWSPDGTQVLAAYGTDESTWLLPADGDPGRKLDGLSWDAASPGSASHPDRA